MLKHRLVTGISLAAAILLAAYALPPVGVWVLFVFVSSLAQIEFYALMDRAGIPVFRGVGTFCGAAMISATFCTIGPTAEHRANAYPWELFVLIASLIAVFVRQFPQKNNDKPLPTIGCTLLGMWYIPYLFNFITRLAFEWEGTGALDRVGPTGLMLVFYLLVVVKMTDTFAYAVGRLLGRRKLIPRISPGKTWEGLIGGIAAGILASWLFCWSFDYRLGVLRCPAGHALVLGAVLAAAGTAGDLFESLLKRAAGAKDSGSILPGMGGLLDVLDSLLFGAPALYAYARLFLS